MSRAPALAVWIHQLGFSWSTADEVCQAVEALGLRGCRSDDLAAAIFRHEAKLRSRCLAQARSRAGKLLKGDGTNDDMKHVVPFSPEELDVESQIPLFDPVNTEGNRAGAAWAQKYGK